MYGIFDRLVIIGGGVYSFGMFIPLLCWCGTAYSRCEMFGKFDRLLILGTVRFSPAFSRRFIMTANWDCTGNCIAVDDIQNGHHM